VSLRVRFRVQGFRGSRVQGFKVQWFKVLNRPANQCTDERPEPMSLVEP
jgi:hypothetical protein